MAKAWVPEIDLTSSPTLARFMKSEAFVRFVVGPIGSGKTFACCFEVMAKAWGQEPNSEGYRPTKFAIVRNTMPDLKRTTMQTWLQAFPEAKTGKMYRTSPVHHKIRVAPMNWIYGKSMAEQRPGAIPGLDLEVHFFSLDLETDVDALLSFEATGIYFNEIREIPKTLVNAATDRVGRYPSMKSAEVMPTWHGVIGDTNPYDEYHWMHLLEYGDGDDEEDLFEAASVSEVNIDGQYEFFRQPPGVLEAERVGPGEYRALADPTVVVNDAEFVQKAAGKFWVGNPRAENLKNLVVAQKGKSPISKFGYYLKRVVNKELDWIRCYYEGKNVFVREGKAVIPEFNPEFHVANDLPILPGVPLEGGIDIGGGTLSPAILVGQRHPVTKAYLIHWEFCPADMGLERFAKRVISEISDRFPDSLDLFKFHADPAAKKRDEYYAGVVSETLKDMGLPVYCVNTNAIDTRIAAIKSMVNRWDFNKPALMISRRGCPRLIKGLGGGWHFKKVNKSLSKPRYRDKPEKDEYSHPCDALGYWGIGAGEIADLTKRNRSKRNSKTVIAAIDFNPLVP